MKKKYLMIIGIILIISGCIDYTSETRFTHNYYTMTALLVENETVSQDNPVFFGKTIDAQGGNINDFLIDNAEISLIDHTEGDSISLVFFVNFVADSVKMGYYDEHNAMPIIADHTYRIEAKIPTGNSSFDLVYGETTIPEHILNNPFNDPAFNDNDTEPFPELVYDTANIDHPLKIQTTDSKSVNMLYRFYCLEDWENAEYINDFHGSTSPETPEEYEDPQSGFPRKNEFWYIYKPVLIEDKYIITNQAYSSSFFFKGRYEISALAIDENYYQFLYSTNSYFHGGVVNGLGYVGSASGRKIYTKVIAQ